MIVGDYDPNTDIDYQIPDGEQSRELKIDQMKYVAFSVDEVDELQTDIGLMSIYADAAGISMKEYVDADILEFMSDKAHVENKGATAGRISQSFDLGVAGTPIWINSANAVDYIADLGTVLDEAKLPDEGRFLVLPAWFCNLLKKGMFSATCADDYGYALAI